MTWSITLEPHPAREYVHGVPVVCIKNQQQVMVDGVRVGYCGVGPGEPMQFIRRYPQEFKDAVVAFVQESLGGTPQVFEPPPAPSKKQKAPRPSPIVDASGNSIKRE